MRSRGLPAPPRSTRCRGGRIAAVGLLWLLVAPASFGGPEAARGEWLEDGSFELRSDRVDGLHRDLPVALAPVSQAGITISLSSPVHELEVLSHRLGLRRLEGGSTAALLRLELRGHARLVARIEVAGLPGELEDQVTLPLQEVVLATQVELERVPDGYRVEVLQAPESVAIAVQSRLGEQLVGMCRALTLFSGGGQACGGLELALSSLRLPMPKPGDSYVVEAGQLTESERDQLDGYLGGSGRL